MQHPFDVLRDDINQVHGVARGMPQICIVECVRNNRNLKHGRTQRRNRKTDAINGDRPFSTM
jgi:hypothetical protein